VTLDTSVGYTAKLPRSQSVEIRLDAFNLVNRKNVVNVNSVIGQDPGKPLASFGAVTSYLGQRQAQISLRYRF